VRGGFSLEPSVAGRTDNAPPARLTVIAPPSRFVPVDPAELWSYRDLLYYLTLRDIQVKYKQTAIGVAWAVLQPLVSMIVFTLFFGKLAGLPSEGVPYPVFSFVGLLPWTYFATALQFGSTSLVTNAGLVQKVYFPRLLLPAGSAIAALLDLFIAMLFLLVLLAAYGVHPTARVCWLPAFVLLAFLTALGCALWLAAVNVKYRDVQFAIPFLIQVWLFVTPVVYPSSLVPPSLRLLYGLNPLVAVVEGFRWALLGKPFPATGMMIVSTLVGLGLLIGGAYYSRRMENEFADVV